MKEHNKTYTAKQLSELLNGKLIGDSSHALIGPEQIEMAGSNHITFIGNQKYVPLWHTSKAPVAVIDRKLGLLDPGENRAFIEVGNADLAMAELLELFRPEPVDLEPGIHPSAFVHESSSIGQNVTIGPNAYIGKGTTIGDNFIAGPHVHIVAANYSYSKKGVHLEDMDVISKGITIGDHVWLGAGVTVTDGAEIGDNTIVTTTPVSLLGPALLIAMLKVI